MSEAHRPIRNVLVTGAEGYVGRMLVRALAHGEGLCQRVVATDLRLPPPGRRLPGVIYEPLDVRSSDAVLLLRRHRIDSVVHLAAVVSPGRKPDRELLYDVEVGGTDNLLACCLDAGIMGGAR